MHPVKDELVDLDLYRAHLGYDGPIQPTLPILQDLVRLHTQRIAFENLSVLSGEGVPLGLVALQQKLLREQRGGYCFEHNTLLWGALQQLGFKVSGLAARVRWNAPPDVVTPIGHMLLRVTVEDVPYIVDAGFGGMTLTAPLRLDVESAQATPHEPFRIIRIGVVRVLEVLLGNVWQALYSFAEQEYHSMDYEVWNWFASTAPASPFVTGLMAARPDAQGRHALRDNRYSYRNLSGEVVSRELDSVAALRAALAEHFLVRVPESAQLDARLNALIASSWCY